MRLRSFLASFVLLSISLLVLLAGCGKEPTPEEKQADSALVLAKAQLDNASYREAKPLLRSALMLDLRLNRPRQLAEEYSLLARLTTLSADFDSALVYFSRAIEHYRSLTDRTSARTLLLEAASLHRQMGEERVAFTMYTEALRLANVFNDIEGMREIQFAMLPACRALENSDDDERTINDLLRAYGESGNVRMQARTHYESSLSFLQREEYQQAVEPLLRALTLAEQARDSVFVITVLATLATSYDHMGNTQQAFETFTDALTRADRTSGAKEIRLEMLTRVGNIYLRNRQFADAGRFYRAALSSAISLENKLAEGYLFAQLGHCALGDGRIIGDAVKSMQNAMELFTSVGYRPGIAYANLSIGIAHQRAGRSMDALTYFTAAVEEKGQCATQPHGVYAECEAVGLRQPSYYDPLLEHLLQTGRGDEAFRYAEQKTEHSLYDQLNALDLRTRDGAVNTILIRLRHARALRVGAERQLAKTLIHGPDNRQLRDDIVANLKNADDMFRDAASEVVKANTRLAPSVRFGGVSIADVQRQLPTGTVLLRSVSTNRSVYSFALTNSRSSLQLAAVSRERLLDYVAAYGSSIRQLAALTDSPAVQRMPLEQRTQELSTQLYAALIRPVESLLSGATHVIVLPDVGLTAVPVHALRKSGPGISYCIEQFAVSYIPSLAALEFQTAIARPVHDIVALGHPGTTVWDVEYELRDIRAFYKDARLLFGQQASLATLQREKGDVLHLAVDLRFNPRAPGNAKVVLSDGKTRDGTREVSWEAIPTTTAFPTVVVSDLRADSIAIDRLLPTLFLANGSSSVIANMHPASRKVKKFFGEIFYTALLAGKSPESAYRQALLEMIRNKEYAAPHMWAPFSLWGK